jgi:cytochrome c nitrite reductase small subunit
MARWLARRGAALPALLLCVLAGVGLGLGVFTFWYAHGASYFSNDPRSCVNCHIMRDEYASWQHASHHANAACNDCHVPHDLVGKYLAKAGNGFWHSKGFTLQDFHEPIQITPRNARTLEDNCIACHQELVQEIAVRHPWPEGERNNCVRCHAAVGHGPPR